MKKFLHFLKSIFTPKFRVRMILPNGVRVIVTCNYGEKQVFIDTVKAIFPALSLKQVEEKEDTAKVVRDMYYE